MTSLQLGQMAPLPDQEYFEALIGKRTDDRLVKRGAARFVVIYFTAKWCGACKRLDLTKICSGFPGIVFYKCDIDENDYTAGYCGINSIPTFLYIQDGKILGTLGSSDTQKVGDWIYDHFNAKKAV